MTTEILECVPRKTIEFPDLDSKQSSSAGMKAITNCQNPWTKDKQ